MTMSTHDLGRGDDEIADDLGDTAVDLGSLSELGHREAMALQTVELERCIELLERLDDDAWSAATECPGWDVLAMWQHVLGACDAGASIRENVRQLRRARAHQRVEGGPLEAALSHLQIADRAELTPAEVVERLRAVAPRTIKGRTRTPRPLRASKLKVDGPVIETWKLGYLVGTIYLRDMWMHRVDTARATGNELVLDVEHDGRIVADVAAEWTRRHGRPVELELTGPAGGRYRAGDGGPAISIDAVEFCRTLSGRLPGDGLLATIVPF